MKSLALANAALLLSAALLPSLSRTAAAAPVSMPYEAAAAGVGIAPAQFAILHALLGWRGGSSPDYSFYKSKDEPLLAKSGITVRPLEDATQRALLEEDLQRVRHDRNNGHKNIYNKASFISPETMVARHRDIIAKYADRITVGTVGSDMGKSAPLSGAQKRELFDAQAALLARLTPAMKALAESADQASFEKNLAAFNDAAAGFVGRRYKLSREAGESFASVVERARNIYSTEAAQLQGLAAESGVSTAGLVADLESLKGRGAFFDGANGEKIPVTGPGSFNSTRDPNAAAPAPSNAKPALKGAVPSPDLKKAERKPGLFGMLGSLLGGLFRTLGRVASALLHGAVEVAKAVLS
jgi:hypothetical protein